MFVFTNPHTKWHPPSRYYSQLIRAIRAHRRFSRYCESVVRVTQLGSSKFEPCDPLPQQNPFTDYCRCDFVTARILSMCKILPLFIQSRVCYLHISDFASSVFTVLLLILLRGLSFAYSQGALPNFDTNTLKDTCTLPTKNIFN